MKVVIFCMLMSCTPSGFSQRTLSPGPHVVYGNVFDARRMAKPPVFPYGADSLVRFYFSHFPGLDSVLTKAIANGDTAKYIRIYFSFVIDRRGSPFEPHFLRIASTQYSRSATAHTINYFEDDRLYYEDAIKKMIHKMTFWAPGLANVRNTGSMVAADARVEDYIQFWVGINPPQN
jgi:hypothetical protein